MANSNKYRGSQISVPAPKISDILKSIAGQHRAAVKYMIHPGKYF